MKKTNKDLVTSLDQLEYGVIGKNGVYKHSVKLLDLSNEKDIQFYEKIANEFNHYIFNKSEIIVHPNGKIYMLVYYMELIKELKSLETKYKDAEAALKVVEPSIESSDSIIDLMSSPLRKTISWQR